MEQVLVWLWDSSHGHGFDLVIILLSIIAVGAISSRYQTQLTRLLKTAPSVLLVVDSKTGALKFANVKANQVLGVRKVGKHYMLPEVVTPQFILSIIPTTSEQSFSEQKLSWPVGSNRVITLSVTGRKTIYRRRSAWLLYLTPYQATDIELKEQVNSLSMIKSAFDNLSELVVIKNSAGEIISSNRAFQRFWQGREDEGAEDIKGIIKGRTSKRWWTVNPDGKSCLLETY
ncbi:diguanylate cyclase, partial [Vibrio sp. M260118]